MRLLSILAFVCVFIVIEISGQNLQEANLYCFKYGDHYEARFTLRKNKDDINFIQALGGDFGVEPMVEDCSTAGKQFIKGNGSTDNPFILVTRWFANGTTEGSDCGRTVAPGNVYAWFLEVRRSQSVHTVQFAGEVNYELLCNYTNIKEFQTAGTLKTIGKTKSTVSLNHTEEKLEFSVVNDKDEAANEVELGEMIALNVKLEPEKGAVGIYVTGCRACSDEDCSQIADIYSITGDDGCLESDTHVGEEGHSFFTLNSGVTHRLSRKFESFRFSNSDLNFVFFLCRIHYCFADDVSPCKADNCITRRERRSAEGEGQRGTDMKTYIMITEGGSKTKQGEQVQNEGTESCKKSTMFLTLTIVMACLLFAAILVIATILVFAKYFRRRKDELTD